MQVRQGSAKELLAASTPLPWWLDDDGSIRSHHGEIGYIDLPDGAIVIHAVNHLPDYEAAVDALEEILPLFEAEFVAASGYSTETALIDSARKALARLRGES